MANILNLVIGFVAIIFAVAPPGLLNMYAAKIAMDEGRKNGLLFTSGVAVAVGIETLIAVLFARYLEENPQIIGMLLKIALGIFLALTIYFFFIAKDHRNTTEEQLVKSKTNRLFTGFFLGAINLLPIPFWVVTSTFLYSIGWFSFEQPEIWFAVLGSSLGSFFVLATYIWFFRPKKNQRSITINMNYLIGSITALISLITLYRIFNS